MWKVYRRQMTDDRLQTTDDRRQVMAIVHMDLWSRWTKKDNKYKYVFTFSFISFSLPVFSPTVQFSFECPVKNKWKDLFYGLYRSWQHQKCILKTYAEPFHSQVSHIWVETYLAHLYIRYTILLAHLYIRYTILLAHLYIRYTILLAHLYIRYTILLAHLYIGYTILLAHLYIGYTIL